MKLSRTFAGLALLTALSGCGAYDRIEEIGTGPKLAPMGAPLNPAPALAVAQPPDYAAANARATNSLWQTGSRNFFHDPRASHIGDLLTVNISVSDTAKLSNNTSRTRTNSDNANLTNFFGLEKVMPGELDPTSLVKMGSDTSNNGGGSVNRSESINMTLAALVTQVLPNGNLVIGGHQQMRVNAEMRDVLITGIVRPEDITNNNTVDLAQIAEARVSYGGRGTVSDVQQPRYGSQLYDILMPF